MKLSGRVRFCDVRGGVLGGVRWRASSVASDVRATEPGRTGARLRLVVRRGGVEGQVPEEDMVVSVFLL